MPGPKPLLLALCGVAGWAADAGAQHRLDSVNWAIKTKNARPKIVPALANPLVCPPALPVCPPAPLPVAPGPIAPGPITPPVASLPPVAPGEVPPATPATPPSNLTAALTGAEAGGTSARATALPQVFGDLLGGGFIAGPLPVVVNSNGTLAGPLPVVVSANGRRQLVPGVGRFPATDESLLGRAAGSRDANATTVGVLPGKGQVFDPALADFVARVPQVVRGAFKVAENDTPRPTTRAYFTYNFYDQVGGGIGGPDVPRIVLHQEVFGYEQAFADGGASVGIRLPYNQLVSPRFLNETSLGDITLTSKVVLRERPNGSLLSAGLLVTVPTGDLPFASTLTGQNVRGTLFQPYAGYILVNDTGRAFVQGFSSVIVPTDSDDVTFLANSVDVGYKLFEFQTGRLATIIPVAEAHVNTPLNHRGTRSDPVGFVDSVTLLGGTHFLFRSGAGIGFAAGAPITGPRPFSLQATFQANFRF